MRSEITRLMAKGKGKEVTTPVKEYVFCLTLIICALLMYS